MTMLHDFKIICMTPIQN